MVPDKSAPARQPSGIERAQRRGLELADHNGSNMIGFTCVGYIDYGAEVARVPASKIIPRVNSLADFVIQKNVDEVVVALQDRRQGLPTQMTTCLNSALSSSAWAIKPPGSRTCCKAAM